MSMKDNDGIRLIKGDITKIDCDAIVNAANSSLLGGGGVDGAIHRVGGPRILEECMLIRDRQGGCEPGEAVITSGGNLPARYVIHTVGPIWYDGNHSEAVLLANCYRNSLRIAVEMNIRSIAFPNISTGVYHFPKQLAAEIAVRTVREFLNTSKDISDILFVCYDDENYRIYEALLSDDNVY